MTILWLEGVAVVVEWLQTDTQPEVEVLVVLGQEQGYQLPLEQIIRSPLALLELLELLVEQTTVDRVVTQHLTQ